MAKRTTRTVLLLALSWASLAGAQEQAKRQDGEDPADKEYRAEASDRPEDMPLAQLPTAPTHRLPPPRPRALEAIDQLLQDIVDEEPLNRERTSRALLEARPDWVSGIARRIDRLAERAERKSMKKLLEEARDATRSRMKAEQGGGKVETPDYLDVMLEHAAPDVQIWRDLTQLLALSRMLNAIGTTDAVREIIRIHVRFGDFMRIDCQRQLEDLEDRAVAGLIEARRHQAPKIASWAEKRLKLRKKLNPANAVRTDDPVALADILVALGRLRDPESTRLLISFAGTEQSQVRLAARQGIALMGDVAAWQLRDAYLNTTGKRPPRDWTWKRTARELFTEFDRLRLEKLYRLFQEATQAKNAGELKKMVEAYDQILVLNPEFERRAEMAEGYLAYAREVGDSERAAAELALQRVQRIAKDKALRNTAEGLLKVYEAKALREAGVIDSRLLRDAGQLAPEAADDISRLQQTSRITSTWGAPSRYLIALVTTGLALAGAGWVLFWGWFRRREVRTQVVERQPKTDEPESDAFEPLLGSLALRWFSKPRRDT